MASRSFDVNKDLNALLDLRQLSNSLHRPGRKAHTHGDARSAIRTILHYHGLAHETSSRAGETLCAMKRRSTWTLLTLRPSRNTGATTGCVSTRWRSSPPMIYWHLVLPRLVKIVQGERRCTCQNLLSKYNKHVKTYLGMTTMHKTPGLKQSRLKSPMDSEKNQRQFSFLFKQRTILYVRVT